MTRDTTQPGADNALDLEVPADFIDFWQLMVEHGQFDGAHGYGVFYERHAKSLHAALARRAAQPVEASDWLECERISDLPAVHETLYNFAQDRTADNATCIVRAVLEAVAAPAGALVAKIEYVPMAMSASDKAQGWHPNDKTPNDPACQKALDARGDDKGQGLDPYWKWGYRAGWQDATGSAAAPADDEQAQKAARYDWLTVTNGLRISPSGEAGTRKELDKTNAYIDAQIRATNQSIPTGEKE